MSAYLLENPVVLIFTIFATVAVFLYLREYNLRKKFESADQKTLDEFRQKGLEAFHQSIKKSQNILGEAELEGVKVVADTRFATSKMEQDYEKNLQAIVAQSQQAITAAQNQFLEFIQSLQLKSRQFEDISLKKGEERINRMFGTLESNLSDFLVSSEQKTLSSIELELKAARNLIENYKEQQLKLIDENIIAMMEQTLNIVLAKKLSLKDQIDLVYEALERAKLEKFVV
ncbi:hypothetical protein A3C26_03510 [Candidatus Daviesbacteria bacterium RIFCSPHIGHO2_02_FULL_39_12]|uniref:Uncharacterized protein n=2 Tax=Candidatus Daviesiibacteriota TaxID=1752718 RepID=A0A1F5JAC7_9BACT|nr:MAG: hypothetical protein A3C26_03510 [Candidatus Daviesbacteria bacterium RIFCSPHIGHO2_02_FULL_39_12]OGE72810.1 MAG: hypothetical protein A3H40_01960 [Candidatus Daviesbacteria bacterium RIFCSPLOWO2_02_FULL_38_15]